MAKVWDRPAPPDHRPDGGPRLWHTPLRQWLRARPDRCHVCGAHALQQHECPIGDKLSEETR